MQLRMLGPRLLQDRDVRVGVFPQCKKILVCAAALGSVFGESVGASQSKMGECSQRKIPHDTWMIENCLEFGGCHAALPTRQVCLASKKDWVQRSGVEWGRRTHFQQGRSFGRRL